MKMKILILLAGVLLSGVPSWGGGAAVILATTTSTQDSGLLDLLVPLFEKESGYQVKTIAVGSGQAMKMGERGEADLLLVHSPTAEKKFMADGFGVRRRLVMHNDFVIVGPASDPAGIRGATAVEAMKRIARSHALFLSRGDNSGTHAKEVSLWKGGAVTPEGEKWYQQSGVVMGQTLNIAAEKRGYTLTDRATFLSLKRGLGLVLLVEGDNSLLNIYHLIELNTSRFPRINSAGGRALADYLLSKKVQELIGRFGVDRFGTPLFIPDAGKSPAALGL